MRKIVFFIMLTFCAVSVRAQQLSQTEETQLKQEINEVKRSEKTIFAEVIEYMSDDSDKAVSEAQRQSMLKLQTHVIEIFAKRLHMSKEDVEEIWDVIDDKCQNIEVRSGDLLRVFTYVTKDALAALKPDINLFPNKPNKKSEKKTVAAIAVPAENNSDVTPAAAEQKAIAVVSEETPKQQVEAASATPQTASADTVATPTVVPADTVATTKAEPAPKESTLGKTTTEPTVENVEQAQKVAEEQQPTPLSNQPTTTTAEVSVQIPALCQTMIDKKDYQTLLNYLNTERAYEKLIFGPERRMRRIAECYIVIVDKGTKNIVAVLDKGATERMNFVTGKMENFSNYQMVGGYLAIFVQEL